MKIRRGVVLIATIGFLLLISAAAIQMRAVCGRWLDTTISSAELARQRSLADAGIAIACRILDRDTNSFDWIGESWAQIHAYDIDGSTVTVTIADLNARINPAAILSADGRTNTTLLTLFTNLLVLMGAPSGLADCLLDWMDADHMPRINGAEEDYYLSLRRPYRCPNRPIRSVEELALIKGFSPEILHGNQEENRPALLDLVTADSDSTINVNTCPGLILRAMGFGEAQVAQMLVERDERPLSDSYLQVTNREAYLAFRSIIRFRSRHFLVRSEAAGHGGTAVSRAVVEKPQAQGERTRIIRMEHL